MTSGATESDNLAILGVMRQAPTAGTRYLLTSTIEHKAVIDAAKQIEAEGAQVTFLSPNAQGRIDAAQVAAALLPETRLVSLMHLNNEIGPSTIGRDQSDFARWRIAAHRRGPVQRQGQQPQRG